MSSWGEWPPQPARPPAVALDLSSSHLYSNDEIPLEMLVEHVSALQVHLDSMSPNDARRKSIEQELFRVKSNIFDRSHKQKHSHGQDRFKNSFTVGNDQWTPGGRGYGDSASNGGDLLTGRLENAVRGRKRNWSDSTSFRNEGKGKSPRVDSVPSPSTFVSTSSPESPPVNGNLQAQKIGPEFAGLMADKMNTPNTKKQIHSDEELARRMHEAYQNGYSPTELANLCDGTSLPLQNNEPTSPSENRVIEASNTKPYGVFGNPIDISSGEDEDEDILEFYDPRVSKDSTTNGNTFFDFALSGFSLMGGSNADSSLEVADNQLFGFGEDVDFFSFGLNPPAPQNHQLDFDIWGTRQIEPAPETPLNGGWAVPGNSNNLLTGAVRNYADYITNDPTKTLEEIKSLLENIRPDMEIPPENREGTPDALVYPLMEHQKVGLAWLKQMEEGKTKGGILADDMGLGKTIQTLALLVSRPSKDPKCKTTLIIAPVALLKQWEREIKKKLRPEHQLSVLIFHGGTKKAKCFSDLCKYDVVLTTYGTIGAEYKRLEQYQSKELQERGQKPNIILLCPESVFYRVVIDEAQCIKNKDTQSAKGCSALRSTYRLCLSGTPMQNSCDELFSLLRFLRVKPYNEWSTFSYTFSRPLKGKVKRAYDQAMEKLQALLKAILLRRTKSSQIDGHPILTLPSKEVRMVHATFSPDEQAFYKALETKSKIIFNKYMRQNAVGKNYSNILVLLLRLRQACCHPHLINDIETHNENRETYLALVKELAPEVVERVKQSETLECPVCLDVSENPAIVLPCGHLFCKECLIQVQNQHEQSNLARGEESSKLRCPGCRGQLDPQKLTDFETFKLVYPPDGQEVSLDISRSRSDDDLIYDTDEDEDGDANKYCDLREFFIRDGAKQNNEEVESNDKGKQKAKGKPLAEVRKDAMRNEKSKRQYHKYLVKRWVDSAKVSKCLQIIQEIQENDASEKTIVFSQFTSLLDLLEVPVARAGINYRRYDGGMSANKRNQALLDFQDDDTIKVLLVSLKAGNSGLNLVAASQVIMFDPFYNPFVELQAIDRAHRIGQQRPVVVHRLVVAGTVEDRVLELQEQKKSLIEGALDENAQRGIARLTAQDLGFLFGIGA